jgi:hypothetical protein
MMSVVNGRAKLSFGLGFFEILIWVFAVSRVIQNLNNPAYAISYALGFALGNWIGVKLEQKIAFGEQVVRIFSSRGMDVAASLRHAGFVLTEFQGSGRDSFVTLLFVSGPPPRGLAGPPLRRGCRPQVFLSRRRHPHGRPPARRKAGPDRLAVDCEEGVDAGHEGPKARVTVRRSEHAAVELSAAPRRKEVPAYPVPAC